MAQQQGLSVPASATPRDRDDADTQSIRSRMSAFDMQDREVDKLQSRQRRRLERHLSSRGTPGGVHPDLQDLAFGPTGGCVLSLPSFALSRPFRTGADLSCARSATQLVPPSADPAPLSRGYLPPWLPLRLLRLLLRRRLLVRRVARALAAQRGGELRRSGARGARQGALGRAGGRGGPVRGPFCGRQRRGRVRGHDAWDSGQADGVEGGVRRGGAVRCDATRMASGSAWPGACSLLPFPCLCVWTCQYLRTVTRRYPYSLSARLARRGADPAGRGRRSGTDKTLHDRRETLQRTDGARTHPEHNREKPRSLLSLRPRL